MTARIVAPPEVACDGPDGLDTCPHHAAIPPRVFSLTAREVRAAGREHGWIVRRGSGRLLDVCPDCQEAA